MRVRLFVEFDMHGHANEGVGDPTDITYEQYTEAAKELVRDAMLRVYQEGTTHSLSYCCSVSPALVFGARVVRNNANIRSAASALVNAVECRLREEELRKAKLAAEDLLRRIAASDMDVLSLNQAYATLDNLVYPLTGQHMNTNMEKPRE